MRFYKFLNSKNAIKSLREKRLKISIVNELNDPFEFLGVELSNELLRSNIKMLKENFSNKYGVLCFSRNWTNPVQWSHYADRHKGICLGFDFEGDKNLSIDMKYFSERLSSNEILKNNEILASNVETECSRSGIDPLSIEGKVIREKLTRKLISDNKKQDGEFMMNLFSIKFEHWKYEEESRLFSTLEGKENGHYYFYYSNGLKIRKVILGIRSSVTGDSVRHALGTGYDNVDIFKVCEDHRKFAVVRDENWSPS